MRVFLAVTYTHETTFLPTYLPTYLDGWMHAFVVVIRMGSSLSILVGTFGINDIEHQRPVCAVCYLPLLLLLLH